MEIEIQHHESCLPTPVWVKHLTPWMHPRILTNPISSSWVPQAPAALRSKDLQVVVHDTISCASFPPARNLWNQCYLLGYQEFWEHAVEKEGDSEASKEVWRKAAEAVAELEDEFRAGVSMEVEYFCVVARKAE